jgi:hypothetical protein
MVTWSVIVYIVSIPHGAMMKDVWYIVLLVEVFCETDLLNFSEWLRIHIDYHPLYRTYPLYELMEISQYLHVG